MASVDGQLPDQEGGVGETVARKLNAWRLSTGKRGTGGQSEQQGEEIKTPIPALSFVAFLTFLSTAHLHMLGLLPKELSLRVSKICCRMSPT